MDPIKQRHDLILGQPPRIGPLAPEDRTPEQQQIVDRIRPPAGVQLQAGGASATEWVETLARHPSLFMAHMAFAQQFMADAALDPRDRELVVLRLGWVRGSPFEWGGHVQIAKACGISAGEIAGIVDGPDHGGWVLRDSALLRAVDELHHEAMISDATWEALAAFLDERQLIELVMLVGHYTTVAFYQNALRLRLPGGNPGLLAR
ncbi:MAG TPA: carboxymuconolactone decarboxylase family protein [Novosphingobium sp.]|nr:carboxymuconolactone decarboxylase family protein [Novosphingobium sp.]